MAAVNVIVMKMMKLNTSAFSVAHAPWRIVLDKSSTTISLISLVRAYRFSTSTWISRPKTLECLHDQSFINFPNDPNRVFSDCVHPCGSFHFSCRSRSRIKGSRTYRSNGKGQILPLASWFIINEELCARFRRRNTLKWKNSAFLTGLYHRTIRT